MSPWVPRIGLGVAAIAVIASVISIAVGEGGPGTVEIDGINETQRLLGGIRQDAERLGTPDAQVEIDLFTDLRATQAAEYQLEVVDPVIEEYVRTERAQINLRHYSFAGSVTSLAATAATAAGEQGRQWQYASLVMRNLDNAGPRDIDEEFLNQIAEAVPEFEKELWEEDFDQVVDEVASEEVDAAPELDNELATDLKIPAQPAVVVTGPGGSEQLVDAPSLDDVRGAIERVEASG